MEIPADPEREKRPKQHMVQMPLPLVIDQGSELREKVLSADVNTMTPLKPLITWQSSNPWQERNKGDMKPQIKAKECRFLNL